METMQTMPRTRAVPVPTAADVEAAWRRLRRLLPPTPVDEGAGTAEDPVLKLESMQPTGSFKVRGALNALAALEPGVQVVTASAGNHGLGVAYAAHLLGRSATVVVPLTASPAKVDLLRRLGVDLVEHGASFDEAEAHALRLAERGGTYVSAYNDDRVVAGQGTIGHELDIQLRGPVTVVCGVGGGGLASGLGLWASRRPQACVVGVEAALSTALSTAVAAGHQVPVAVGQTLADGMAGNIEPGSVTVDLVARHVAQMTTVSEAEIREAIRYLAAERGYVAEGSAAAPVAALRAGKVAVQGRAVAVLTGRNIALPVLAAVLAPDVTT